MITYVLTTLTQTGERPICIGKNFAEVFKGIYAYANDDDVMDMISKTTTKMFFKIRDMFFIIRALEVNDATDMIVVVSSVNEGMESIFSILANENKAYDFIKKYIDINIIDTNSKGDRYIHGTVKELNISDNGTKREFCLRTFTFNKMR